MKIKLAISKNVFLLGLVSFFNDVASEMTRPLIPIFLTTVLAAPMTVVGLIEGIAEATASILKVLSGWLSDRWQRRKGLVVAGYSFSALSQLLLSIASVWPFVLLARFIDRFGKGIRTSARDALIVDSSSEDVRGRSFGFHRSLDTLGAVVGPLLALIALYFLDNKFRLIFIFAFFPAFIAILLLFFVQERRKENHFLSPFRFNWSTLNSSFKIFLLVSFIFALSNSSEAFLILRGQNLGLSINLLILVYVCFNVTYALFSTPAGIVSDKFGPRRVLLAGFLLFSLVYLGFGLASSNFFLWFLFPIYGVYMALTDGVGKAYISYLVPQEKIGTAFGLYQFGVGICTFFASFITGLLWNYFGARVPFIYGSILALISAFLFLGLEKYQSENKK
jgi:MFS family permease